MTSRMLAKHIASHAIGKKAGNVVLMDLRKMSGATDFFVICTGTSDTQVKAIADAIRDGMAEQGHSVWHSEGFQARQWILLDYVDVVVHVFHKDVRNFYNLERLWSDAKIHPVEDTGKTIRILPAIKHKSVRTQRPRRTASTRS